MRDDNVMDSEIINKKPEFQGKGIQHGFWLAVCAVCQSPLPLSFSHIKCSRGCPEEVAGVITPCKSVLALVVAT